MIVLATSFAYSIAAHTARDRYENQDEDREYYDGNEHCSKVD